MIKHHGTLNIEKHKTKNKKAIRQLEGSGVYVMSVSKGKQGLNAFI